MKSRLFGVCAMVAFVTTVAWTGLAEAVTNVRGIQRAKSNLVDIYYDLESDVSGTYTIDVTIEGKTDEVTATTFSGDVGDGIVPGQNRHIVWDAGADWPKKKGDMKAIVTVTKEDPTVSIGKVQLWEGGPYWADRNIGASAPEDYGLYFWWGDTTGYSPSSDGTFSFDFSFDNSAIYTYITSTDTLVSEGWIVFKDNRYVLTPSHDAAHVKWGGNWRMPTSLELLFLGEFCDWTRTTMNGVDGYIVRGRGDYTANSIFLPCAGEGGGTSLSNTGSIGYCWSFWENISWEDSLYRSDGLSWGGGYYYISKHCRLDRYFGLSVRPVQEFATTDSSMTTGSSTTTGSSMITGSSIWFHVDTTNKCDFKICLHGNGGVLDCDSEFVKEVVTNEFNYSDRQTLPKFKRGSNKLIGWQLGTAVFDWTGENYKGEPYRAEDKLIPDQDEIIWEESYIQNYAAHGEASLDDDGVMVVHLYAIWTTTVQLSFADKQSNLVLWPQLKEYLVWWCGYNIDSLSLKDGMSVELPPGEHDVYGKAMGAFSWYYDVFKAVNAGGDSLEGNQNTVPWSYKLVIPSESLGVYQDWEGAVVGESIHINVQVSSSHKNVGYVSFNCVAVSGGYSGKAGFTSFDLSKATINILPKKSSQEFSKLRINGDEAKVLFPLPAGEYTVEYEYANDVEYGVEWTPYLASESVTVVKEDDLSQEVSYVPFGGVVAYCVTLDSNGGDDDVSYRWFRRDVRDLPDATIYLPSSDSMKRTSVTAGQMWFCSGWYDSKSGGRLYQSLDRIDGDIRLYAHWTLVATTGVLTSFDPEGDDIITLSQTIEFISANAFELAGNVKEVVFEGNAPQLEEGALDGLSPDCTIRVLSASSGWGVTIPGTWNGFRIEYIDEEPATAAVFTVEDGVLTKVELNGETEVVVPDDVTSIGEGAFNDLGLTKLTICSSVTNIHPLAFDYCSSLVEIMVDAGNPAFCSKNGMLLTKDGKTLVQGVNGDVVIPSGVVVVGDSAFYGCSGLKSVTMPNSVTTIGDVAFGWCGSLASVAIPNGVTTIGVNAFLGCNSLTSATIGTGVVSVGWGAFEGCDSLLYDTETVSGVKMVDGWAVGYTESLPAVLDLAGARGVVDGAFCGCSVLTSVIIPDGVKRIGESAFCQCYGLTEVTISGSVATIGYYAFGECENLTNVVMGVGVEDIGAFAFCCCSGMSSLTLPNSVTNIGEWAFSDTELANMTIPPNVASIGDHAFYRSYKLSDLIIAGSVVSIGQDALGGCFGLTNIAIYGNALKVDGDFLRDVREDCVVRVRRDSTGWGVSIPGEWNGRRIEYIENYDPSWGDLSVPDGFVAEISREAIPLSWNMVFGADAYEVWRGTTGDIASATQLALVKETLYSDGDTVAGVSYRYWVRAIRGEAVSDFSDCVSAVRYPREVGNLRTESTALGVLISWTASPDATSYDVCREDAATGENSCIVGRTDATCFTDTTAVAGVEYLYWVGACVQSTETGLGYVSSSDAVAGKWIAITPIPTPPEPVPAPSPAPEPTPTPEPEEVHELYEDVGGAAPTTAASEYSGYLFDSKGNVKGTIQVKIGKPGKKDGKASVKATVVIGTKKVTLKAKDKGNAEINPDGPTEIELVGGEACEIALGADGLSGYYGAYEIDGARNFFASKAKGEVSTANAVLAKWLGSLMIIWDGGSLNVSLAAKGKVKVSGTLASGTKVSASTVLLVGDEWSCVSVAVPKSNLSFVLWLSRDGGTAVVEGLGDDVLVGKPGTLANGATFQIDPDEFAAVFGQAMLPYLPDGVPVKQTGTKWTLSKAGKVAYKNGAVDESKLGDNPCGLKLTYKAKDGTFKGSFKVYAEVKGKPKATTVNVTGLMLNGVGYGTATIKGKGSVAVAIK